MINQDALAKLRAFHMSGFIQALVEQSGITQYHSLSFEDRLSLLIEAEHLHRADRALKRRLKDANLLSYPTLDQLDFSAHRGVSRLEFLELCQGNWLANSHNLIITGATGAGKTFLASVLITTLCSKGKTARYFRLYDLINELLLSKHENSFKKFKNTINNVNLLIFDDWLLDQLSADHARDIIDIIDKRFRTSSCIFITQLPVNEWYKKIADPTLADAILDRIVHDSLRIELLGESMRKITTSLKKEINVASLRQP